MNFTIIAIIIVVTIINIVVLLLPIPNAPPVFSTYVKFKTPSNIVTVELYSLFAMICFTN